MDNLQLEINFSERRNRFRDALNAGEFVLLVENSSPGRDNDPAASADRLAALENAVLDIKGINASLAITDRCHTVDVWRARRIRQRTFRRKPRPACDLPLRPRHHAE